MSASCRIGVVTLRETIQITIPLIIAEKIPTLARNVFAIFALSRIPSSALLTIKKYTRYNLARTALDEAIAMSHNLRQLEYHLSEIGYTLGSNPKRKYWTIKGKGDFSVFMSISVLS